MAQGFRLASTIGGGSVGFKHKNPTQAYEITLPNENIAMPMMRLSTAQASTSGTFIDFTDVPSWAKRITVMFNGVSTNGISQVQVQLGVGGGIENTNYNVTTGAISGTSAGAASYTSGFVIAGSLASDLRSGSMILSTLSSNIWVTQAVTRSATNYILMTSGDKTLSAPLTQIRITTVNGTDLFDAGSINVLYEGY